MKRTKLLALTLVVAIMLVGAGYAAWTDTLKVDHNINTGYLDFHFVDPVEDDEFTFFTPHGAWVDETPYADSYLNGNVSYSWVSGDQDGQNMTDLATVTLNNAYPGARFRMDILMKNNGTIPAILDDMGANWGEWEALGLKSSGIQLLVLDINGNEVGTAVSLGHPWALNEIEIPVGGFVRSYIYIEIADGVAEQDTITVTLEPEFKQFNK